MRDIYSDEIRGLEQRILTLTRRASIARPDESLVILREAIAELETSLEELRQERDALLEAREASDREHQWYVEMFDCAPEAYVVTDTRGAIRDINREGRRLLRRRHDDFTGKPLATFVHEADRAEFRARLSAAAGAAPTEFTLHLRPPAAPEIAALMRVSAITDARGEIRGLRWLIREAPADTDATRSLALEGLPALVWTLDGDGNALYTNACWRERTGVRANAALGEGWRAAVHPDDLPALDELRERLGHSGTAGHGDCRLRDSAGAWHPHTVRIAPIRDQRRTRAAWVCVATEVPEQREGHRGTPLDEPGAEDDEFVGLLSHELKAPITTVLGNAEVLLKHDGELPRELRTAALTDIYDEAARLHHIVEDLLSLARVQRGDHAALEPILVSHIVRNLIDEHRRRYPQRHIVAELDADATPALGERVYVEQILRNLLSNAEKYSSRDTTITVRVQGVGGDVCVTVADRGEGLSARESREVFKPFVRLSRTALQATGTGIGLTVCKRLVEAQSGRIWAQPRPGGGTEFCFTLPLADEADDA